MDRLELYRIFVAVVETQGFSRAADRLGRPRSSVSAAVMDLEARLGAKLLHRTTRVVAPTAEGAAFYERALLLLAEAEDLEGMFRRSAEQVQGRVRVDVPERVARRLLVPALGGFLEAHPEISVDLGATDRAVDLVAERVDCALRVGTPPETGASARRIGEIGLINVAAPSYLARFGEPRIPTDLARHHVAAYASPTTGRVEKWSWMEEGRECELATPNRVTVNSAEAQIACALAGLGVIQIPAYDVREHLAAGELVEFMPEARAAPMPLSLLFPHSKRPPRRVTLFADWLEGVLRLAL